ncbi:DUF721 domain-containing protein [bacterium]|nr:DUF721 domain-containing protein [bacterium]
MEEESKTPWEAYSDERRYVEKKRKAQKDAEPGKKIVRIDTAIEEWIEKVAGSRRFREADLLQHFHEIIGEPLNRHVSVEKIERGTLYLHVPEGPWRHQLFYMRKRLMENLNETAGREIVREIVFSTWSQSSFEDRQ